MTRRTFLLASSAATAGAVQHLHAAATAPAGVPWTQWGVPHRNFPTESKGIKPWGAGGPKVVWKRVLGEGYSSASVDSSGVAYTMYGKSGQEVVIALDA